LRFSAGSSADRWLVEMLLCPLATGGAASNTVQSRHHVYDIFLEGLRRPAAWVSPSSIRRFRVGGELRLLERAARGRDAAKSSSELDRRQPAEAIDSPPPVGETMSLCAGGARSAKRRGQLSFVESILCSIATGIKRLLDLS
jgi:hypothetical protein